MEDIKQRIKQLICQHTQIGLVPDQIGDDQPLFGGEPGAVGLDSIEALEIVVGIEEEFDLRLEGEGIETAAKFFSVTTLADYVEELLVKKSTDAPTS